jgi:hypothetical protein
MRRKKGMDAADKSTNLSMHASLFMENTPKHIESNSRIAILAEQVASVVLR